MSLAVAEKTVELIGRLAPTDQDIRVTFHGGEPLLAGIGWFETLLPQLSAKFEGRIRFSIQSNLWAVDDAFAALFRKYRVRVGTSVDGCEEICDSQRGPGTYAKTKAGEALLRSCGIPVGEICTLASPHAHRAAEVFRRSEHPYALHGAVPSLGNTPNEMNVTAAEMERILLDSYDAYHADPAHNRITSIDAMAQGCFEGKGTVCTFFDCLGTFAAIAPDGEIYACQRFAGYPEFSLGNVADDPSSDSLTTSAGYRRLSAAETEKKNACRGCGHAAYCGGCLFNALTVGTVKDPYCDAYRAAYDRINYDMALEMGRVLLGKPGETPVLAMAGDRPHPYDQRRNEELNRKRGQTESPSQKGCHDCPTPEVHSNREPAETEENDERSEPIFY